MRMSSFQQRTDDLYRLKTRNLVFQNVDGTYPAKGNIAYTKDTVGSIGFSSVVLDSSGNMTVPGNVDFGNGAVTVNTTTRKLNVNYGINVVGGTVTDSISSKAIILENQTQSSVISQLYDTTTNNVETLTWRNNNLVSEPISGWDAKLTPAPLIFRTVDISGLSGTNLVMAQNMNNLLSILLTRQCFVAAITNSTTRSAVFNTTVGIQFKIYGPSVTQLFNIVQSGSLTTAVTYTELAARINNACPAPYNTFFKAGYNTTTNLFDISVNSPSYQFSYSDISTNGSGQLYFNHLYFNTWTPNTIISRASSNVLGDLIVLSPSAPIFPPTRVTGATYDVSCQIQLPVIPSSSPITIANTCIYWCVSGTPFPTFPNAIIPASQSRYTITGLTSLTTYNVALSYRSAYDESAKGPSLTFTTVFGLTPYTSSESYSQVFSVDVTQDPNWLETPSYGVANVNYTKQYVSNVKYTVASVFAAIFGGSFSDLANINQINSVTIDFYAGVNAVGSDVRFFTGPNPNQNILYTPGDTTIEPEYDDAYGVGGTITIYPDADGIDMLHEIFNAGEDGVIDTAKNISFGWFCSRGGAIRNCEVTGLSVVYVVM